MDYCTSWFEGWWADCCAAHDLAYSAQIGKAAADLALATCVAGSGHGPLIGAASVVIGGVMWLGVRVFGRKFYKNAAQTKV